MLMKNLFKNKYGELLARDYVIILVIFGAVVLIMSLIVADMANNYNVPNMIDQNFQNNYDTFTAASANIYQMQNASTSSEGMSTVSTYMYTFKSTFSVISLLFGSLGAINSVMVHFASDFGIPSVLANIIFPAVFVMAIAILIFIIIGSVNRSRL